MKSYVVITNMALTFLLFSLSFLGYHLPWALAKFKSQGGEVQVGKVDRWQDLEGRYPHVKVKKSSLVLKKGFFLSSFSGFDAVMNCTGFGAKSLCKDPKMLPIRGQVFKVKAPWCKMVVYGDSEAYIIPGDNHYESRIGG